MKIRIGHFYAFALICLSSLFGLAAHAGAQDDHPSRLSDLHKLEGRTVKARKARIAQGSTYSVLYSFCSVGGSNCLDGAQPGAGPIQDAAGNLYGTTRLGGANGINGGNSGTVFKLESTGHETVLYSFCSAANCTDGVGPQVGLIQDAGGNLYGTTFSGGAVRLGVVFKVDNTGLETVLHSFVPTCSPSGCTDGYEPSSSLIEDAEGNLYGTTEFGGANGGGSLPGGTIFKVDATGHETVLYSFCSASNCADGAMPAGRLLRDAAGNLYGTTTQGGNSSPNCGASGCGTVFKLDSTGHETVLYSFCSAANCTDGELPNGGLIQDPAGNLYGTAAGGKGGLSGGAGVAFKVDTTGHETVLYNFCSVLQNDACIDGYGPDIGLIQDAAGNLYGTTGGGGSGANHGGGTIFKLDISGHETLLYNFCSAANCADGAGPTGPLIKDAAGNLYGTTGGGGANGLGTVFELAGAVNGGGTASVTLTSTLNPSYVDQSVTLSAVVSGSGPTPTGTVTFQEGSTALGTVTLANGKANLTTTFTSAGSFSIVASYSGDQNYQAANSSPLTQVVNQYTTRTALASSLNPSTYGQAVTLTATVSSAGPTPTGTVTFKNGSKSLGSASLSGGVAQLTTSTLKAGTLKVTASYGGDTANAGSTSPVLKQVVNKATSTTTVVSSLNPSKVGQTVKFTATVTSPTTTPTGKVTFMDGSTVLGTGTLKKGMASYSTSALSAGSHNITAVYAGTSNVIGSTSPVLVQTVN